MEEILQKFPRFLLFCTVLLNVAVAFVLFHKNKKLCIFKKIGIFENVLNSIFPNMIIITIL